MKITRRQLRRIIKESLQERKKIKNYDGNTGEPLSAKAKAQCAARPKCAEEWPEAVDELADLEKEEQELLRQHQQRMKEIDLQRKQMRKAFKIELAIQEKQLAAIKQRDMDAFEKYENVLKKVRQLNRNDKFEEAIALYKQLQ